jgi:hypothetical protein
MQGTRSRESLIDVLHAEHSASESKTDSMCLVSAR